MSVTDSLRWAEVLPNRLSERERQIAPPGAEGDSLAAGLPGRRRAGLPDHRSDRRRPCRAARRSASGWPPRSGRSLMGVLYILDEPTIGLHQKDNAKLIATLVRLRDLGNTLIVVEHDEETIRTADWVLDIGPRRGRARRRGHRVRSAASACWTSRARSPAPTCAASGPCPSRRSGARATARRSSCAARGRTTSRTSTSTFPLGDADGRDRRVGHRARARS